MRTSAWHMGSPARWRLRSIAVRRDITVPGQLGAIDLARGSTAGASAPTHTPGGLILLPEYRDAGRPPRPPCNARPGATERPASHVPNNSPPSPTGNKSRQEAPKTPCSGASTTHTSWHCSRLHRLPRLGRDCPDNPAHRRRRTRQSRACRPAPASRRSYRSVDRSEPPALDGLLEGRSGIDLVAHSVSRPPDIPWYACLLLTA